MRLSDCSKSERALFAVGVVLVVLGVLLVFGIYTSWWSSMIMWLRRASRIALPLGLIALGVYVVQGARNHAFDHLFDGSSQRQQVLERSGDDSRIAGVCGGIAQYFGIESTFVRVIAVLMAFASPLFALIAYAALVLVIPHQ
ncbi:MAG: PspC domain-containing protein [Eggerthellaceae bacterium]|nr:PspC domain-containing protein [Eggerthellaceae bacterium]